MPGGGKPGNNNAGKGKPITDAIIAALHREIEDKNGVKTKRLYVLADKLVTRAIEDGDMTAIREVLDRVEGKPTQERDVNVNNTSTLTVEHTGLRELLEALGGNAIGKEDESDTPVVLQ